MGFPMLARWHLYIESGPWSVPCSQICYISKEDPQGPLAACDLLHCLKWLLFIQTLIQRHLNVVTIRTPYESRNDLYWSIDLFMFYSFCGIGDGNGLSWVDCFTLFLPAQNLLGRRADATLAQLCVLWVFLVSWIIYSIIFSPSLCTGCRRHSQPMWRSSWLPIFPTQTTSWPPMTRSKSLVSKYRCLGQKRNETCAL